MREVDVLGSVCFRHGFRFIVVFDAFEKMTTVGRFGLGIPMMLLHEGRA